MLTRFFYGIRIALRQAFHEWLATLCLCMAIAAVILPILLMFGLKNGVIYSKTEKLRKDPNTLLIRPNGRLDSNIHWSMGDLRAIEASPNLQHVVPQPDMVYRLGAYLESDSFKIEQKYFQTRTQFRITQENDPLLAFGGCKCPGDREIVLNFALAKTLQVKEGDKITMSFDASANALTIPLKVAGVLPDDYVNVDGVSNTFACVNLQLANAIIDVNSGEDNAFGGDSKKLTTPPAVYTGTYWVPDRPMSDEELAGQLPDFNIISSSLSAGQKALLPEKAVRIQYAKTATSDAQKDEWKRRMDELGKQGTVLRWVDPFTTVMEKNGENVTLSCAYNTPRLCAAMQEQCSPEHATLYESEPFAEGEDTPVQKRRHAVDCAKQLQNLISEGMATAASYLEFSEKLSKYQQELKSAERKQQGTKKALDEANKALEKAKKDYKRAENAAAEKESKRKNARQALNRAKAEKAAAEKAKKTEETAKNKETEKDADHKDDKGAEDKKNKGSDGKKEKPDPVPGAQKSYDAAAAAKKAADDKVAAAKKKLDKAQEEYDKKNAANIQAQNVLDALKDNPPTSPEDRKDLEKRLQEVHQAYQKALEAVNPPVPDEVETLVGSLSDCLSGIYKDDPETFKKKLQECQERDVATRLAPHFTFDELYPRVEGSEREEVLILSKTGADANGKALVRIEKRYGLPGEPGTLYTAPEDAARLSYCASAYHWNYKEEQEENRLVRVGRYYKFVAYAKDMDAVEPALKELSARSIECTSSVGEIEKTRKLDRHLTLLLLALSSLSGTGGMVALVLNLVNSAEKRRKDYALLRTIGVGRISMALMPIYESLFVMICTLLMCFAAYYSLHFGLNSMAGDLLDDQETMFSMPLGDLLSIVGICLMLSVVAALLSAFRLSRLSPAEYLREM